MSKERCASKITDRVVAALDFLSKQEFKKALLTWDRIEDEDDPDEPGVIVVPILKLER